MIKSASRQSGNILIYILGAIFLLGLLIVITKGNYQPGAGIDAEGVIIKVSEVRRYASELERGVQYAMNNGVSETDLRFAHINAASAYGTYGTNPKAEIFNPQGGGVEWKKPPSGIQTTVTPWVFSGHNSVNRVGTWHGTATEGNMELLAILPYVTLDFCNAVNNSLGWNVTAPPKDQTNSDITSTFSGTFGSGIHLSDAGGTSAVMAYKTEGCYEGDSAPPAGTYHYYKVLLAR